MGRAREVDGKLGGEKLRGKSGATRKDGGL